MRWRGSWRTQVSEIAKFDHSQYLERETKKDVLEKVGLLTSQYLRASLRPYPHWSPCSWDPDFQ